MASIELNRYRISTFSKLEKNDPQSFYTKKKKCLSLLKKEKTLSYSKWELLKFLDAKEYANRQQYDTSYKYNDVDYFKSLQKENKAEFSRLSDMCIMDLLNTETLSQSQWQVLKFLSTKSYNKKRYMVFLQAYEEEFPMYFEAFKYLKFDEELNITGKENEMICKAVKEHRNLNGMQDRMLFYSKIFCRYSISALLKYAYSQSKKNKKIKSLIGWACEQFYKDVSCCKCLNITARISYVLPLLGTQDSISYFFTTNWMKLVAEDETTSCDKDLFFLLFVVCLLFPHFFEYKKFKNIFIGSECLIGFLRNYDEQSFDKNKAFLNDVIFRIIITRENLPSQIPDNLFSIFKENVNQLLSEHLIKEADKESENKKVTSLIGNDDIHITTENNENVEKVTEPTLSVESNSKCKVKRHFGKNA